MGTTAERIHDRFPQLTKERADRFALPSQQKVAAAYDAGKIQPDLVPVADQGRRRRLGPRDRGRGLRPETTMEGLAALKTPFRPHGRVTAGNVVAASTTVRPRRSSPAAAPRRSSASRRR